MTGESAVRAALLASAEVAGLIGTRIYALRLPQTPTLPAITYQRISAVPDQTFTGPSGLVRARIQIDAWASSYPDSKALAAAIRHALQLFKDPTIKVALLLNDRDLHEDDIRLYRVSSDWSICLSEEE